MEQWFKITTKGAHCKNISAAYFVVFVHLDGSVRPFSLWSTCKEDREDSLKELWQSLARWPSCVKHQEGKCSLTTSKLASVCLLSSGGWQRQRGRQVSRDTLWLLPLTQEHTVWERKCWTSQHDVQQPTAAMGELNYWKRTKWMTAWRAADLFCYLSSAWVNLWVVSQSRETQNLIVSICGFCHSCVWREEIWLKLWRWMLTQSSCIYSSMAVNLVHHWNPL